MDIIEIKNFSIFLYEEAQDMMKDLKFAWNLLEIWIFPDFSWPSKILFFPDFYLTCGNHEQLNVEYKRGLHCFFAQWLVHITRTILSINHMQNENQRRLGQSLFILFLALRHSIQKALIPIFTLKIKGYSL